MRLIILGHSTGCQGEVTFCKKLLEICSDKHLPAKLVDIFELIPAPDERQKLSNMSVINIERSYQDKLDTNYSDNPITKYGFNKLQEYFKSQNTIVFFGTMPYHQIGLAKIGILKYLPTIAWFYPYSIKVDSIYQPYLRAATIVTTYSPIGIKYLLENNVPKHKIVLIPIPYPKQADITYKKIFSDMHLNEKNKYLNDIGNKMGKVINIDRETIVFGMISRITPMYNHVFVLKQFREMAGYLNNFILIIKSPQPTGHDENKYEKEFSSLVDQLKSEQWFLFDDEFDTFDLIYDRYKCIDVSIFMSGAGQAAVEQAALGTHLLLLDIPYNRSIFSGISEFVRCLNFDDATTISIPDSVSFQQKIRFISENREHIKCKREANRAIAKNRFSSKLVFERLDLALKASMSYFRHTEEEYYYKNKVAQTVEHDLSENF